MYVNFNANPSSYRVGDCVIRAISKATKNSWELVFLEIAMKGLDMYDMPSSNRVWGSYLIDKGYVKKNIPDTCPAFCYTIKDFCRDNPKGTFIVGTGEHVIAVVDGDYYDTWDSGDEVPLYYFGKDDM